MNSKFTTDSIDNFKWIECQDGIHILEYCGNNYHLIIPDTIEGKPVTTLSGEYDSVYIPACVKHIDDFEFADFQYSIHKADYCIEIDPANPYLRWENRCLYEEHDGECRLAFCDTPADKLVIDEKVTIIGRNAFLCIDDIDFSKIKLPQGLKKIERLNLARNLSAGKDGPLAVPESVESLAPNKQIKYSNLENNPHFLIQSDAVLTPDGKKLLAYTGNASEFTVPETVEEIVPYAFERAFALKKLTLSNVKRIHDYAFDSNSIKTLRIPASLEMMGNNAFSYRTLSSVMVDKKNKHFYTDKIALYRILEDGKKELMFCFREQAEDYTIAENTVSILKNAFRICSALKTLTLPEGLPAFDDHCLPEQSQCALVIPDSVQHFTISGIGIKKERYPIQNNGIYFWEDDVLYQKTEEGLIALRLNRDAETVILKDETIVVTKKFAAQTNLKTVVCPMSLRRIEEYAFLGAPLESITLNEGLTTIEMGAFTGTKLKKINLPATLETFADALSADSLTTCTVEKNSPFYCADKGAVYTKDMKKLVVVPYAIKGPTFLLPDTVEEIGSALSHCSKLKEIVLGASLRAIPNRAFRHCDKLQKLVCNDTLEDIGENAFSYASSLTIDISIHTPAYAKANSITQENRNISFYIREMGDLMKEFPEYNMLLNEDGITILKYNGNEKTVVIPEKIGEYTVTQIHADAFYTHHYSVEAIELPDTITELPEKFFENCNNLKTVRLPQKIKVLPQSLFNHCHNLKEVVIPDGVTCIEDEVFFGCDHITKIVFPASITKISEHLFSALDENGKVTYKDLYVSDETLHYVVPGSYAEKFLRAYKVDSYLTDSLNIMYISTEETDNSDAERVAELLRYMDQSVLPDQTIALTWESYSEYTPEKVIIPSHMTGIPVTKLDMNISNKVIELEIPETVTEISHIHNLYSYFSKSQLKKITIHPDNPNYYSDGSAIYTKDRKTLLQFVYAESGEYHIPEGTEIVAESAFSYVPHLTKVTLPKSIRELKQDAFFSCILLDTIEGLEYLSSGDASILSGTPFMNSHPQIIIGKSFVKYNQPDQTTYTIPEGIKTIESGAFSINNREADSLQEIILPSTLTHIESMAFLGRKNLKTIHLPEGLQSIKEKAFHGCISLESITLPSTLTELGQEVFPSSNLNWNRVIAKLKEILVADGNEHFRSIDGILYSADGKKLICCPDDYPKKEITLPETVTTIGRNAFCSNDTVEKIHLPASLSTIENSAFLDAKSLKDINLENVTDLEPMAFQNCESLQSVSLNAKNIPQHCFSECKKLTYVKLNGTQCIDIQAFYHVPLTSICLPETLTMIGQNAFNGAKFPRITLPKSIISVGSFAFAQCPDITVYDTIDPQLQQTFKDRSFKKDSSLSRIGTSQSGNYDYEITVLDAKTDEIKYKVWMGMDGSTWAYTSTLSACWSENAAFDFKKFDESFSDAKGLTNKINIALNRLRYPIDLTDSMQKAYVSYLVRMAKDVMKKCIDTDDMDTLLFCEPFGLIKKSNIDEMLDYAVACQKAPFSAYFIDYKNKHFQSKKDPFASLQLDLDKPSKDWKTSSAAPNRVTRYQGTDIAVTFPTEVKGKKIFGIASTTTKVPNNYKALVSVVIPEGYTDIGDYAFYGCENLESVTLPSTLQTIGKEAFSSCPKLKEIVIPASVQWMGDSVFYDCVNLSKVIIEQGALRTLPAYAFSECNKLTEIELPQNIDTLNTMCLNCDQLRKLTLHTRKLTTNGYIFGNTIPEIHAYKGAIKRIQGVTRNNIFLMDEDKKDEAKDVVQTALVADGIFRFTPVESITFTDKIFVLTGFGAEEEERITNTIVSKGGIIKSSVVLKTNYLIVNSEYDHETAKYLKALELLEQGKNIAIISEQQFKTFS